MDTLVENPQETPVEATPESALSEVVKKEFEDVVPKKEEKEKPAEKKPEDIEIDGAKYTPDDIKAVLEAKKNYELDEKWRARNQQEMERLSREREEIEALKQKSSNAGFSYKETGDEDIDALGQQFAGTVNALQEEVEFLKQELAKTKEEELYREDRTVIDKAFEEVEAAAGKKLSQAERDQLANQAKAGNILLSTYIANNFKEISKMNADEIKSTLSKFKDFKVEGSGKSKGGESTYGLSSDEIEYAKSVGMSLKEYAALKGA